MLSDEKLHEVPSVVPGVWSPCVHRPGPAVGAMLEKTRNKDLYNELLVDSKFLTEMLPGAVEAFIGVNDHDEAVYRRFLAQYNLNAVDVALVKLNLHDWENPFGAMY